MNHSRIKLNTSVLAAAFLLSASIVAKAEEISTVLTVTSPCQTAEAWALPPKTESKLPKWLNHYQEFVGQKSSALYSFSEAVHLKRLSALMKKSDFEHDFSEFWVGRILFQLKFDPLAHTVFKSILENSPTPAIRKAAFGCLAEIQKRTPQWKVPEKGIQALPLDATDADAIFLLSMKHPSAYQKLLPEGYQEFITGIQANQNKKYSEAVTALTAFLASPTSRTHPLLAKYVDQAHLLLAHSLYSVARFKEASDQFQKVSKTSNQQIEALNDLSWSYLLANQYDEAIGVSLQLRSGSLHNTFSPEPIMVAAMALNELCSYPDSIRMINAFVNDYTKTHEWLTANSKDGTLYPELLKAIKGQSTVPAKITGEWMRMPAFLSSQESLNQLIEQPRKLVGLQKSGANEQDVLTAKFIEQATRFVKEVKVAKLKLKPEEQLASSFGDRYLTLKRDLRNLSRFYKASKIWRNLAKNYEKRIPGYRSELVAKINHSLKEKNAELLATLNKVHDNTDLIEVEIYDGASQDLIWKNAHPDFEKITQKWEEQHGKREDNTAKTWNWGRFLASDIENAEVWEDELGALKADTSDQCGNKEKYLQVQVVKAK